MGTLYNVGYVTWIMFSRLSVLRVYRKEYRIVIDKDACNPNYGKMKVMQMASGEIRMMGFQTKERLFKGTLKIARPAQAHASVLTNDHVCHERFRRIGNKVLRESASYVRGISGGEPVMPTDCDTCAKSKLQHVLLKTAGEEVKNSSAPLKLVFSDVVEPRKNRSMANSRNIVTLLDDCIGYILLSLVDRKC